MAQRTLRGCRWLLGQRCEERAVRMAAPGRLEKCAVEFPKVPSGRSVRLPVLWSLQGGNNNSSHSYEVMEEVKWI